jgi:lysozyme
MAERHWKLDDAAKFVAKWEGFLEHAYLDTLASPAVWTCGFGHSDYAAPPHVNAGTTWTEAEALKVLTHDLRGTSSAVSAAVKKPLTFRQRMALISAAYNLGPGILATLAPMINAGHMKQAADTLLQYDHAGGVVVEGLLNRRKAERWMMLHDHLPSPHKVIQHQPQRKKASHGR